MLYPNPDVEYGKTATRCGNTHGLGIHKVRIAKQQ